MDGPTSGSFWLRNRHAVSWMLAIGYGVLFAAMTGITALFSWLLSIYSDFEIRGLWAIELVVWPVAGPWGLILGLVLALGILFKDRAAQHEKAAKINMVLLGLLPVVVGVWAGCLFGPLLCLSELSVPGQMERAEKAAKGMELYSWTNPDGEWRFALLAGTNALKSEALIKGMEYQIVTLEELGKRFRRLAENERVYWSNSDAEGFRFPDEQMIKRIQSLAAEAKVELHLPMAANPGPAKRLSGPVIGQLKTGDKLLIVRSGPKGPLYTVKSDGGAVLAQDLPASEVGRRFPELKEEVERGMAEWGVNSYHSESVITSPPSPSPP